MKQVISALQLAAIRTCLPWGILWFQNYIIRKGKINFSSRSQTFILFVPRLLNLSGAMMAENERRLIYFYCVTQLFWFWVWSHIRWLVSIVWQRCMSIQLYDNETQGIAAKFDRSTSSAEFQFVIALNRWQWVSDLPVFRLGWLSVLVFL